MKAIMETGRVMITLPLLGKPRPSRSGKSLLVASSRGMRKASFTVDGKPVYVVASAFVRNDLARCDETDRSAKRQQKPRHGQG